jgi:flagellar motor switch protein FliM
VPDDDDQFPPEDLPEDEGDLLSDDDIASILGGASLGGSDFGDDDLASILAPDGGDGVHIGDLLDQTGIDALMRDSVAAGDVILRHNGVRVRPGEEVLLEDYDFANPHFLSETQMRRVRLRHEQFIFNAASRLSMQLQTDFGLRMSRLETQPYQNYTDNISNPSHIVLFRLNQLKGVGVIAMGARLAMTIVDRLLGGGGHSVRQERFLSELEIILLEDFLQVLLEQWCQQFSEYEKLHAEIIGYENHGRFLQTAPRDAQMLVLTMEAILGDCSESIQIGIPYYAVEPIIKKMQEQADANNQPSGALARRSWWDSCDEIRIEVKAEWTAFECTVRDLLRLRQGDVLRLSPDLIGNTEIWCNNTLRFAGRVGVQNGQVAVEVLRKMNSANEDDDL